MASSSSAIAAGSSTVGDYEILDAEASKIVTELVNAFGFDLERSVEAVKALGEAADVGLAVAWLLDNGEEDRGGAVTFSHCPHLDAGGDGSVPLVDVSALTFDVSAMCADGCASRENWLCLQCGTTRCSRYVKKHQLEHAAIAGHPTALSLSDLSTWCFRCDCYVRHPRLSPIVTRMQALKHGEGSSSAGPSAGAPAPAAQSERKRAKSAMPAVPEVGAADDDDVVLIAR